jgi:hypothetical protein
MAVIDKLTAIGDAIREKTGSTAKMTLDQMAIKIKTIHNSLIEDIPTTLGEWACLSRASQMRDIKYTTKGRLLHLDMSNGTYVTAVDEVGTENTGLWYTSVRALDWGFIGYGVSMYSLMTCINNPKSFIYTKTYSDYFTTGPNGGNVYGTNCTDYVSYCLDLPYLTVTDRLPYLECMCDETGVHNINGMCWNSSSGAVDREALRTELQLCDIFNSAEEWGGTAGHAVIVTGIRRDADGVIQELDISESTVPFIIETTYDWDSFVSSYIGGMKYRPYRCSNLANVTFPENLTNIVYSDIVTNRGDKISIRPNQDIALNVLSDGYAGIVLFKDGVQVSSQANTNDWNLTGLTTGKYTAVLYRNGETVTIDDATDTNSTSFIVCAVTATVSKDENDYIFTYSAEAVNGITPTPVQVALKDSNGFTQYVEILKDNNFNGSASVKFETPPKDQWSIVHIPFKTEYGFVIAETTDWTTP